MPLIDGALAHIACTVHDVHEAGDHTLYIGRVRHLDYRDGAPLLFYTGGYRRLDVGLSDECFFP